MGMHPFFWTYLLRLMGLMIVIDEKIYQEEVEVFVKASLKLQKDVSPNMIMTKKMALDWFVMHRDELKAIARGLDYDEELIAIIRELRGLPQKLDVLKAMIDIAVSDDFYHEKEKMIIKKTILYWNVDAEDLDV